MDLLVAEQVDPEILITAACRSRGRTGARRRRSRRAHRGRLGRRRHRQRSGHGAGRDVRGACRDSGRVGQRPGADARHARDTTRAIGRILNGSRSCHRRRRHRRAPFVNVAGVGFDAHIAGAFAAIGRARRGFLRYGASSCASLDLRMPHLHRGARSLAAARRRHRAFLLSFANGRQWGNGAIIAPSAELDDGAFEAVLVEDRGRAAVLRSIPRLFAGTIASAQGVSICRIQSAIVSGDGPLLYHVDGEPYVGGPSLRVSIRPGALRLRA